MTAAAIAASIVNDDDGISTMQELANLDVVDRADNGHGSPRRALAARNRC